MTFQEICNHLEDNHCSIDHLDGNMHFVYNIISLKEFYLEESSYYDEGYITHACYILGIPIPISMSSNLKNYQDFLEQNDIL